MIGCWLLVFGCRLVATILPTTKYQQPITLNFFFVFFIDILFSKQPNNIRYYLPEIWVNDLIGAWDGDGICGAGAISVCLRGIWDYDDAGYKNDYYGDKR